MNLVIWNKIVLSCVGNLRNCSSYTLLQYTLIAPLALLLLGHLLASTGQRMRASKPWAQSICSKILVPRDHWYHWYTRNQIDYILCSQRWRSSIQSAKTRPGADCGPDHELLIAKFRLKLKKVGENH